MSSILQNVLLHLQMLRSVLHPGTRRIINDLHEALSEISSKRYSLWSRSEENHNYTWVLLGLQYSSQTVFFRKSFPHLEETSYLTSSRSFLK